MVTLINRRDYYDRQNGTDTALAGDTIVPLLHPITMTPQVSKQTLEAIPGDTVQAWLDGEKIARLELEIDALCGEHVSCHIDPVEKAHWMGMADAIARKQSLWGGDQLSDTPDPVAFPPITSDEKTLWSNLAIIQGLTTHCRDAAAAIAASLYQMTSEEINALPADWAKTHILWP